MSNETHNTNNISQLFLVMPVYNEQDCIKKVLIDWINALKPLNIQKTFIIINDGSTDQTSQILKNLESEEEHSPNQKLVIMNVKNAGHGAAIQTGYQKAFELASPSQKSAIFQVDSDDQFVPEDFYKLWKEGQKYKFVFGHRQLRYDARNRLIISSILRKILWVFFGVETFDPNIPFRLMHTESLKIILKKIPVNIFAPNIFITILAILKFGEQTKQGIAVTHKARMTGKVSIVSFKLIKVCFKSLKQLLVFKYLSSE